MNRLTPDLIHVQVAGEYAEAAAGTGLPWVLTLHGIRFLEVDLWRGFINKIYRGWFIKREERRALNCAKHIISISPFIQSTFNKQIRGNIYNIENPVETAFFNLPQHQNLKVLLFVGRLIPRKGVHSLLQAFAKLNKRIPEAKLRIVGGSDFSNEVKIYSKKLKQFVVNEGLEGAVTFIGELDKPALLKEYSQCSVLVLSSVVETAPMVITEAMAAGKAVVSTDAGGARYLVEHGQTGFIVPPNDENSMEEALYQVLSDEAKLKAMGNRARFVARQRFHAEAVASQTRKVYYKVLGQSFRQ
jgi:glycosyltransferase involved in cell wall biosynthesis